MTDIHNTPATPLASVSYRGKTYPVSIDFVVDDLFWSGVDLRQCSQSKDRLALIEAFARANDWRLRKRAAESDGLTPACAAKLSRDAAFEVRLALSDNGKALSLLSAQDVIALGETDSSVAVNLIGWGSPFDDETRMHLANIFMSYYGALDEIQAGVIAKSMSESCRRTRRRRKALYREELDRCEDEGIRLDMTAANVARFQFGELSAALAPDEVIDVLDHLKETDETFADHLGDWLEYPDVEVLEHLARDIVVKPFDILMLLTRGGRKVGLAALKNEHAAGLSTQAIRNFIGSDPSALEDVLFSDYFGSMQTRIAKMYRDDADAELHMVVNRFEVKQAEEAHWFEDSADDTVNDDCDVEVYVTEDEDDDEADGKTTAVEDKKAD